MFQPYPLLTCTPPHPTPPHPVPPPLTGDAETRAFAKENEIKIFRESVIYRLEDALKAEMEKNMPTEKTITREVRAVPYSVNYRLLYEEYTYFLSLPQPTPVCILILITTNTYLHLYSFFVTPFTPSLTHQGTAKVQQLFTLRGKLKSQGTVAGLYVQTGNMKAGGTGAGTFRGSEYTFR